jgi:hypothetical protein
VNKRFFGAVQYRFCEGWNLAIHLFVGFYINAKNNLKPGQTSLPFGYGYQPFDDRETFPFMQGLLI